jgi:hypothetical protein
VVVVAVQRASFTISFDAEKTANPRKLPAADAWTLAVASTTNAARSFDVNLDGKGLGWLGWAFHETPQSNLDGGRTRKIDVGCQTASKTEGASSQSRTASRGVSASAIGPGEHFNVKATYQPTIDALAPTTTSLQAFGVFLAPIPVEAAKPTAA